MADYKKRILYIILGIIALIIVLMAGFVGYIQLSIFVVQPIEKNAVEKHIEAQGLSLLNNVQDNIYEVEIATTLLNNELANIFIDLESMEGNKVSSLSFDVFNGNAKVNYVVNGFYVPVYCEVTREAVEGGQEIVVTPKSYGNSKLNLPLFLDQLLFKDIFKSSTTIQLNMNRYNKSLYFRYNKSEINQTGLIAQFYIVIPALDGFMKDLKDNLDQDLVEIYEKGSESQKEALEWILNYDTLPDNITNRVFKDYLGNGKIIKDVLILANPVSVDSIYDKYPDLYLLVNKNDVVTNRGLLIGDAVIVYTQVVLDAINKLAQEDTILFHYGTPYNFDLMENVTIEGLKESYNMDVEQEILDQMELSYTNNRMYVIYTTGEGQYIASYSGDFLMLDEEEYQDTYKKVIPSKGGYTTNADIYKEIYTCLKNFYGEDVFVRYLKDDGKDAFAIISLYSDYQNFKTVAITKKETKFEVLGDRFASVVTLNQSFSDFNLNLTTRIFENPTLLLLNNSTINNIKAGLIDYDYLEGDEELVYCSYDGKRYIYIELNSGEKYIYTLYQSVFLENIFPLEEALETFDDIDPLIILQEKP